MRVAVRVLHSCAFIHHAFIPVISVTISLMYTVYTTSSMFIVYKTTGILRPESQLETKNSALAMMKL